MDVTSILQKMRVQLDSCDVDAQSDTTETYPAIFKEILVQFRIKGPGIKPEQAMKAVTLFSGMSRLMPLRAWNLP
jgi:putative redox protein